MNASVIFEKLGEAFILNIQIFFITLIFALPLGLIVTFGSMSKWKPFNRLPLPQKVRNFKPIRWVTRTFIWIIRGTPLMLQLIVIFYGPGLLGFENPWAFLPGGRMFAAYVAFIINYACYFSEIYRGGIESITKGQKEAGLVLGMTRRQIFFKITLLQVVKRILPPTGNEFMTLIKDTALANIIANKEIIMMAREFATMGLIWPLFSTAIFFLIFCGILTLLFGYLEKKLDYFKV